MTELKTITRHAASVLVGQLAVMAYSVVDTVVAGRYSAASLAALSVGAAVYVSVFVALLGVMQALLPTLSEHRGAQRFEEVGRSFRQALYLFAILCAVGLAVLLSPGAILRWTEVPAPMRAEVEQYLGILTLTLPPALLFRMYSTLNQSLGHPMMVTWLQIGSLLAKIPLSIWFGLGGLGLDAHGAAGCAWASVVVNYALLTVALWTLRTQAIYRPYAIWRKLEPPRWGQIAEFAKIGVPGGLTMLVEVTSFTLMALFIARLGTVASASHQIASNMAAVLYMMPLAISVAVSARVSFWLGAGDVTQAKKTILLGFWMVLATSSAQGVLLYLAREPLALAYSNQPEVAAMAAPLLAWVAVFHLFDGLQALCLFILRCFRVAVAPFVIYGVFLWGGGLGGGYALAYVGLGPWSPWQTASAFWLTSSVALGATALTLIALLTYVVRGRR